MSAPLAELKERLAEISDLRLTLALLAWDQEVMMPSGGTEIRAEQFATLERIAHERFAGDETGRLLDRVRPLEDELPYDADDAALIRVVRRDWDKARRVPAELQADLARAAAEGHRVWVEARRDSDYRRFRPALERNLELRRRYVECFDTFADPYDVLLDDYEPGLATAEADATLERLRAGLVPLVDAVRAAEPIDASFLAGPWDVAAQKRVERAILVELGFDETSWRLDEIVHPAAFSFGTRDIRITTRYSEESIETIFSSMHEFGHGLYERQVDPALDRTPLGGGASMALHESQSRLWENLVGREPPFWRRFFPLLRDEFPERLRGVDAEAFERAVSKVAPSLIRVDADEITYSLHVILRFRLERQLLAGTLSLDELPEAWNAGMEEFLGVEVPDDARGVLQDSHWSGGAFGYFPTYALGNVVCVQLWNRLREDLPGLDDEIEAGEFGSLRRWLGEHVHRHGRKFTPRELLERAVGSSLDPEPYLRHLRAKVERLYGVAVPA